VIRNRQNGSLGRIGKRARRRNVEVNERQKCEKCSESTKRLVGFWDGFDVGGFTYDCDSQDCQVAIERRKAAEAKGIRCKAVRAENRAAGVNPAKVERLYREKGLTLMELARAFNVSPATMSSYLREKMPFPSDLYEIIMAYLGRSD